MILFTVGHHEEFKILNIKKKEDCNGKSNIKIFHNNKFIIHGNNILNVIIKLSRIYIYNKKLTNKKSELMIIIKSMN